jgi:hypothetical protein
MFSFLLMHVSLFPQQVWQFLRALGQKVLAAIVAVLMPLSFGLGLTLHERSTTDSEVNPEPLINLIYVELPAEGYEEVPQAGAGDRRGAMQEERREGRCLELLIDAPMSFSDSVLLPNRPLQLHSPDPDHCTTLPNVATYPFGNEIELRPLWMYG